MEAASVLNTVLAFELPGLPERPLHTLDTGLPAPWTGPETWTRAYAWIIDGVNKLELKDLQRPPEWEPEGGRQ